MPVIPLKSRAKVVADLLPTVSGYFDPDLDQRGVFEDENLAFGLGIRESTNLRVIDEAVFAFAESRRGSYRLRSLWLVPEEQST
jgi:hypothetical protein